MIVIDKDLEDGKLKTCALCNKEFKVGESYEKITTHRKTKLVVHTECVKSGI